MKHRNVWTAVGLAALALMLVALPGGSKGLQSDQESSLARMEKKLGELQEQVQAQLAGRQDEIAKLAQEHAEWAAEQDLEDIDVEDQLVAIAPEADQEAVTVLSLDGDGSSWLGVEIGEVNADAAKELKLSAERGVVLNRVAPDSPAAKAGLKEKDVITEVNGQRVEGAAQFRRMIREIPAGRTVQLSVWRDGRTQATSATLGKAAEGHKAWAKAFHSGDFAFHMPQIHVPEIPNIEVYGEMISGGRPRLGIDAEDLSGELGNYFGAPEGEGVLVRGVNSGSPAEKAGLKAGDVIIKLNGERIRTIGDLRERLAGQREAKTVKLGVIRNRSEISLEAAIEAPATPKAHKISRRTNI